MTRWFPRPRTFSLLLLALVLATALYSTMGQATNTTSECLGGETLEIQQNLVKSTSTNEGGTTEGGTTGGGTTGGGDSNSTSTLSAGYSSPRASMIHVLFLLGSVAVGVVATIA